MKQADLKIYKISDEYIKYLYQYDHEVMWIKSQHGNNRPYVGILLSINNIDYFAPLSSPIRDAKTGRPNPRLEKHFWDSIPIKNFEYGKIKLNKMIPIPKNLNVLQEFNFNNSKYTNLIRNQTNEINKIDLKF